MSGFVFKDKGWGKIKKGLASIDVNLTQTVGKAGIQGNESTKKHESDEEQATITNGVIGLVHEFGSEKMNVPERAPIRRAVLANQGRYSALAAKEAKKFLKSKGAMNPDNILGIVAEAMVSDIKNKIRQDLPPGLSFRYKQQRLKQGLGSRTLVISGQYLNSFTAKVGKK